MGNIIPFLRERVFEPQDIQAMSLALDEVCAVLKLPVGDNHGREAIAERIIALAGRVSVAPSNCASGCFEKQRARQFSFV